MDTLTADSFFNGRIQVLQQRCGYRFSIDAVLIAAYAGPGPADIVLDLGTGCGIIPLILADRNPKIKVYGIEVQQSLADLAMLNVEVNGLDKRIHILCMDMKALQPVKIGAPIDLVVSNPPYRKAATGRINPDQQRAVARHEIKVTLPDFIETARRMLRVSGRLVMIYPAERMTDLIVQMRSSGIEPKLTRMIHSAVDTRAKLILVEGRKGGRPGLKIGPPLIIYQKDGSYTDEVQAMFAC
jgi:tRNA1(Val) A37 N6-methylase TrmN6